MLQAPLWMGWTSCRRGGMSLVRLGRDVAGSTGEVAAGTAVVLSKGAAGEAAPGLGEGATRGDERGIITIANVICVHINFFMTHWFVLVE